jgi:hypothetical protein
MGMGPGQPVDLDVVDAMAATATEGADRADDMWSNLQDGFLRSGGQGRSGAFSQGALAGRAQPVELTM